MRVRFRVRNILLILFVLPVVFLVVLSGSYIAVFAYRTNSCSPGDRVIQSAADAIAVAKRKIVKDSHFSSESFGSAPDFVTSLDQEVDCCSATGSRTVFGVVVWEVSLISTNIHRSAAVALSNCGDIFVYDSFIYAD
jgi:hypothetical protein